MAHPDWSREEVRQELETEYRKDVMKTSFLEVISNAAITINGKTIDYAPHPKKTDSTKKKE